MKLSFLKLPLQDIDKFESLQQLRERLLRVLLVSAFVIGTILYGVALIPACQQGLFEFAAIYTVIYFWLILVTFWQRVPHAVRAVSWLLFFYILGVVNLLLSGFNSDAAMFFLTFVGMTALLYGLWRGMAALGISALTIVIAACATVTGAFQLLMERPQPLNPLLWIIGGSVFLLTSVLLILSVNALISGLVVHLIKASEDAQKLALAHSDLQASEERYRLLVDISPDLIVLAGLDGKIILANPSALAFLGYDHPDEVTGSPFLSFIAPEDRPRLEAMFHHVLESGSARGVVCRCLHRDGTRFHVEFSASCLPHAAGAQAIVAIGRDVTARIRAERAMQDSKQELENKVQEQTAEIQVTSERLKELVARSPAVIFATKASDGFPPVFFSENVQELTGYTASQILTVPGFLYNRIHGEDVQQIQDLLAHLFELGEFVVEYRFRHADGAYRWMRDQVRLSRSADGQPLEIVGSMIDITVEKQAEEAHQSLLDKSAHGITIFQDNRIVYINHSITEQLGFTLEDFGALSPDQLMQLIPEQERLLLAQGFWSRRVEDAISSHYEVHLLDKRGEPHFLDLVTVPIVFRGRPALQTTVIDLTERERMEAALRESEEIQRVILDASPSSLMLLDSTGTVLAANRTTAHRFGKRLEEIIGQNVGLYFPEDVARFRKTQLDILLQTRKAVRFEDSRAGMWFDTHAYPILSGDGQVRSVIISAVDITERKQMEQSLAEANSRLEARVEERTRELAESREQLRKLAAGVIQTQEEERRRVSRELHDEAGQALVSMKFSLETILSDLPAGDASLKGRLTSAIHQVDQTMEQVRHLSKSLHPALLDIADLNLALKDTCQEFGESTGVQVEYRGVPVPDLPKEAGLSFFRFLQEALTNVAKHSRATRVDVRLAACEGNLILSVADNGIGAGMHYVEGLGHLGMHERFGMLHGNVEIRPHNRPGFFIAASIPWKADAQNGLAQAGGALEDS